MASLIQDVAILEAIAGDVVAFSSGSPVTQSIGGYHVSVKLLPNGPVAPYQTISGSFFDILGIALADYAAFSSGAPISIAEKFGNSWFGIEISKPVA